MLPLGLIEEPVPGGLTKSVFWCALAFTMILTLERFPSKWLLVFLMLLAGSSAAGCKRSVCEAVPLDAFWKANEEMVPPGATVCRSKPMGDTQYLEVDFADDPNPFVTITMHMESKGFHRISQDIKDPNIQSMLLERGKPGADFMVVGVNLSREDGRWHASLHTEGKK